MLGKRILAVFLCLCLMVPCIGLQLVTPSAASDSSYVIADFGLSVSGMWEATSAVSDFFPPASTKLNQALDLSGYSNLGIQLDLYTSGDNGLVSLLESTSTGVSGQIELTSSGTCDVEERAIDTSALNFQRNTWVRQVIPMSSFYDTTNPGLNTAALNYVRVYALSPTEYAGQKAIVKICNVRLVNLDVAAPSTTVDPIGDGTFAADAPQWKAVDFGAEYEAYSDPLVAGYNMREYAETHAAELGLKLNDPNFDWSPVFRSLVDGLNAAGGGALFIPAGEYSFFSEVYIPRGVTVHGEWASPENDRTVKGTILKVYCGKGGSTPFVTMSSHSQIQNLSIWYPEQKANAVAAWAPTVLLENYTHVKNVNFVNSYFAIQQKDAANSPNVSNVFGTPLSKGLDIDMVIDISRLEEIHFSPDYWIHSGLAGAPCTDNEAAALRDYVYKNAIGVTLRRVDWSYLTYANIQGYKIGVELTKTNNTAEPNYWPNGQLMGLELYGCLMGIAGDGVQATTLSMADIKIGDCDYGIYLYRTSLTDYSTYGSLRALKLDVTAKSYALWLNNSVEVSILDSVIRSGKVVASSGNMLIGETVFHTASPQVILQSGVQNATLLGNTTASGGTITVQDYANISETNSSTALNVKDYTSITAAEAAPQKKGPAKSNTYVASLDNTGKTDVTEDLQTLLTAAGNNGGGLVYVPPGKYLVNGSLTVPTGVELRGAGDFASMPAPVNTIFLVTKSGGASAAATVNLEASAGIRAITFHYPEQMKNNGSNSYTFTEYPYMIRSKGSNVYVINVASHNACYGVDLATNRSDNHYVDGLSGHFFRRGIVVGNGSANGVLRNYHFNYNAILNANTGIWGSWGVAPFTEEEKTNYFHLAMQQQIGQNMIALQVGDVTNQLVYDSFNYGCKYGVQLTTDSVIGCSSGTSGANGIRLFGHAVDWSLQAIRVEAGTNIQMLNIQVTAFDQKGTSADVNLGAGALGDSNIYDLYMASGFNSDLAIHNFVEWGPKSKAAVYVGGGTLTLYNAALNNNDGYDSGYFFDVANSKTVNVIGFTTSRTNTPRVTDYNDRNYVKINGGFYASALKYYRYLEMNFGGGSNLKEWDTDKPTDFVTTTNFSMTENSDGTVSLSASGNAAQTIPAYFNGKPVAGRATASTCAHGTTTLRNYKAATINTSGYTGDTVCSACGAVTEYGRYVAATGYAYFDTVGGTLSTSHRLTANGGNTNVVAIGSTGEYGIKLTGDWQGFNFAGDLLRNVPEGQSVTMAIEYYVDANVSGQLFRYQAYDGKGWTDLFTKDLSTSAGLCVLENNKSYLVFYTFTADEVARLRNAEFNFSILGCGPGANVTYIQSARLVDTAFVYGGVDRGYDYGYFEESVLCDYYPDITGVCEYNVAYTDADYRYIKVFGDALAKDTNKCQPVYIKFYAASGYENSELTVNAYEALIDGVRGFSTDLTGKEMKVTFKNGVGELYLPQACFTNGLNSAGSFRLAHSEIEKLTHFEVYDVTSYCAETLAQDATVARMHELMLEGEYNLKVDGYVAPSLGVEGYTGDTVCATCGALIKKGEACAAEPYAWLETAGGKLTTSHSVVAQSGGNTNVVAIGNTGEYGIKLTGDWQGFALSGKLLEKVPANTSVTVAIEYYINSTVSGGSQIFRYQAYEGWTGGEYDGNAWNNLFVDKNNLVGNKSGLVFYTFTAAELAAMRNSSFKFNVRGCGEGANITYIQSIKIVDTAYVHADVDNGCTYYDFEERLLCDYYPDIYGASSHNMTAKIHEATSSFAGYQYFWVTGEALVSDKKTNKPLLLKFYATEGNENASVGGINIDVSDGSGGYNWGTVDPVAMKNGVGSVVVNAGFANRLNSVGSMRIAVSEMSKVARVEVYDISSFCTNALADATVKAEVHAWMIENNYNVQTGGAVEPTYDAPGYSAGVVCKLCGETLVKGEVLDRVPYAWIETDGGKLTSSHTVNPQSGNTDVVAIGSTGKYGIQLTGDWQGFNLSGKLFDKVPAGQSVTMAIEYYVDGDAKGQLFRYRPYSGKDWVDLFTAGQTVMYQSTLVNNKSHLVFYTFSAEEIAALRGTDFSFAVLGCAPGANVTYIQSLKLVKTEDVHGDADFGYSFYDFEEKVLCDFYPDIKGPSANQVSLRIRENTETFTGFHYYWLTGGDAMVADKTQNKPIVLKFYAAAGYENATIGNIKVDTSNADGSYVWGDLNVTMKDGVGTVVVNAGLANRLNSLASLRVPVDEQVKYTRVEIYDVATYCAEEFASDDMVAYMHDYMQANSYNLTATAGKDATCTEDGMTAGAACATCGTAFAGGEIIPATGHKNVVTTTVNATCTVNGSITETCKDCGMVVSTKVITATGHTYTDADDNVCNVCGADATVGYFTYTIANGEATITGVNTAIKGNVTVPATFEGAPVTAIAANAFANCTGIKTLTLPATLRVVGKDAFLGCTGLTAVYISDLSAWCGVDFGSYTANPLYYAHKLYVDGELVEDLVIPSDVTEIGFGVFYGCTDIVTVTVSQGVTTIGRGAFYGCSSLESVVIADSVQTIGYGAFYECMALYEIEIGSGVKTIDNYAFYGCLSLEEIELPEGLTTIGNYAFRNAAIYTITLPDSVTSLGVGAFYDCAQLSEITLPNGLEAIANNTFYNCVSLGNVEIPDSVTTIGTGAFRGCESLETVTLGAGLTTIEANAFRNAGLVELTIPVGVTAIGNNAFRGCANLTTVYYNAAYATMGVAAYPVFAECTALSTVYVGSTVTAVPAQAFRGTTALATVYLTKNTATIEKNAFYECGSIADVYFVGTATDALAMDVKSFNTALTDANWNYNTPCFEEHTWTADCDSLCDLCGEKRETTHANVVNDAAVAPTCDTTGLTAGSHCAACGNVIVRQTVIAALGHTWNEGEVIKDATAEANGEKKYTCTVCSDTKTVVLTLAEVVDGYYYYNGEKVPEAGLVQVEDNYYYVSTGAKVKTGRYAVSNVNDLEIETGIYYFFEDGTMNLERGVYEGYYYNDTGKTEAYAGLIEWNGAKYYVNDYGQVKANCRYFISKLNGLVPQKRAYTFLEDGRMLEDTRIHTDGFYYEDGIRIPYAGLVEYEGAFYYVSDNGAYVTNTRQIVANPNNTGMVKNGRYYFDANGKMVFDTVINGYYYGTNGVAPSYAGLVEVDGSYYYVSGLHGALVVNTTYAITNTNGLMAAGTYTFDANGKLVG